LVKGLDDLRIAVIELSIYHFLHGADLLQTTVEFFQQQLAILICTTVLILQFASVPFAKSISVAGPILIR